jgi:hypothetical protein
MNYLFLVKFWKRCAVLYIVLVLDLGETIYLGFVDLRYSTEILGSDGSSLTASSLFAQCFSGSPAPIAFQFFY